MSEFYLEFY
nr:unnamed protein product [Callosobruchus chinensis]